MTIRPAITTIERLCADALVAAERRIEKRIAARLDTVACDGLDRLTTEMLPGAISRFIWLRRIEPGNNSAAANRLLDRLERSEEHTSELQSLMRISYAVFCLKKKKTTKQLITSNSLYNAHYTKKKHNTTVH